RDWSSDVCSSDLFAGEHGVARPIEPAPAAMEGFLEEDALEAQADLLHDAAGGEVLGEARGFDAAHAEAVEGEVAQGGGELGAEAAALDGGVEDPADLGLLPDGLCAHVGLGPGVLPFELAGGDDRPVLEADDAAGQHR